MDEPEDFGTELVRRFAAEAVVVGPALLGTLLLGPVGLVLGAACSAGIVIASAQEKSDPPA